MIASSLLVACAVPIACNTEAPSGLQTQAPATTAGAESRPHHTAPAIPSSPDAQGPEAPPLIERLRSEEPTIVAQALAKASRSEGLSSPELRVRVLELTEHTDPGVRGRALRVLGEWSRRDVPARPPPGAGWGTSQGLRVETSLKRPEYVSIGLREASIARAWAWNRCLPSSWKRASRPTPGSFEAGTRGMRAIASLCPALAPSIPRPRGSVGRHRPAHIERPREIANT